MEQILKIEKQTYEDILQVCEHNGQNWQDDIFPATR